MTEIEPSAGSHMPRYADASCYTCAEFGTECRRSALSRGFTRISAGPLNIEICVNVVKAVRVSLMLRAIYVAGLVGGSCVPVPSTQR